jgi:hypothetical protein
MTTENGIFLLTISLLASHKFHPLDSTVFGSCKTYHNACIKNWMLLNSGQSVIIYSVAGIIGKSSERHLTKHNIEKMFNVKCIYPIKENIFDAD